MTEDECTRCGKSGIYIKTRKDGFCSDMCYRLWDTYHTHPMRDEDDSHWWTRARMTDSRCAGCGKDVLRESIEIKTRKYDFCSYACYDRWIKSDGFSTCTECKHVFSCDEQLDWKVPYPLDMLRWLEFADSTRMQKFPFCSRACHEKACARNRELYTREHPKTPTSFSAT